MNDNTNVVVVQQQDSAPFGLVSVLILCGMVALIATYFWQIVIVAGIVFTGFVAWLLFRDQQLRARELAVRADEQNRLFLEGDPRGIYGGDHEGREF